MSATGEKRTFHKSILFLFPTVFIYAMMLGKYPIDIASKIGSSSLVFHIKY